MNDMEKYREKIKVISFDREKNQMVEVEESKITFDDVGGMEDIKKKINMDFIMPIKNPEYFQAFGKKVGGSLLFYGPPGCGKTFLARAVAGEINANFIHLELQAILSMWSGEAEKNLHEVFEEARKTKPCILFIDELDAYGGNRQKMGAHHQRTLVNQLLVEMDGSNSFNEGVYIIGATNTPWYIDPALRRPGRFNSLVFVAPPNNEERLTILELKTKDKPRMELQLDFVSKYAEHFSGADLTYLVEDSINEAIQRSFETGQLQPLSNEDLLKAMKNRQPTTLDWFSTAKNYATFSDVNKDFDKVLEYMEEHQLK
ncbi:ATP-binding protein [Bacillus wiedmannii]|uniref:ATP-binding protein n=1 Tax=Bacillus wiedmannii TaxID=1890302 RepID=UPI00077A060F|nr:ATP-binding protein [Bacillus wiedmannii]KXY05519.1 AAA family ATPase [Bacillus wiedmannii]OAK20938.1 AAA family ATPase [Bacillus wiedmannii]